MGVRLQLNYPSLLGYYGGHVKEKAVKILKNGWYDMAGSDFHKYRSVTRLLADKALKKDGAESLRKLLTV